VIVTGLGEVRQRQSQPAPGKARLMESRRLDGSLDYQQLERPAVIRKQVSAPAPARQGSDAIPDVDYLDIPAFLRRQEEA
ncbi:MAG TPA: cell division protein FtsZ, partial [Legionella sp.]|nr:cell division protein FtsZ [Legionella sp.]